MSIIKSPDSLNAAIQCTKVVADAMTAAAPYPQDGPIYKAYEKAIFTLCDVADRLARDALFPEQVDEPEAPPVEPETPEEPAAGEQAQEEQQEPTEQPE